MRKLIGILALLVAASAGADDRYCQFSGGACESHDAPAQPTYDPPTTWRGSEGPFGGQTWSDNHGNTIDESTDQFGNQTFRDNQGGTVTCQQDFFGNTVCQ